MLPRVTSIAGLPTPALVVDTTAFAHNLDTMSAALPGARLRPAAPLQNGPEYDAVVASGEQVTSGLLAVVLEEMGIPARSWLGWQIPILTSEAHGSARM